MTTFLKSTTKWSPKPSKSESQPEIILLNFLRLIIKLYAKPQETEKQTQSLLPNHNFFEIYKIWDYKIFNTAIHILKSNYTGS